MSLGFWLRSLTRQWGRRSSTAKSSGPTLANARLRLVRLEDRRVLNAAPLAVLAGAELTVQAGDADGQSDLVHLFETHDIGGERLHVEVNGAEVFSGDAAQVSRIHVQGSADDDTLLVDLSGGNPLPSDGLTFDAGGQSAGDQLLLSGASLGTVNHSLTADASGAVQVSSPDGLATVTFTHVETVYDTLEADARDFTIGAEADHATLSDAAGGGANELTSDLGTQVVFATPIDNLAIRLGSDGDDSAPATATLSIDGSITLPGGTVHLDAGSHGTLLINGQIDTSDPHLGEIGGEVHLLGERVGVFDGAVVNVSGAAGGGTILLGGDYQGTNVDVPNADFAHVGPQARLLADALTEGDGGRIIVWSNIATRVFGELGVRGAGESGAGGFVETSSRNFLDVTESPVLASPSGQGGTWLLDPHNLLIGFFSGISFNVTTANPFLTTGDTARLDINTLLAAFTGGVNVIVQTQADVASIEQGNITLTVPLNFPATANNSLTLNAHNSVIIDGPITGAGSLNLTLRADRDGLGDGDVVVNQTINLGSGNLTSTGINLQVNAPVFVDGGQITIDHLGDVNIGHGINALNAGQIRITSVNGSINNTAPLSLVQARDVMLIAANGIGSTTNRILTNVNVAGNFAAQLTSPNANRGIFVTELAGGGDLRVGVVNNSAGIAVAGVSTTNDQSIDVRVENGSLFVNGPVLANGTGSVLLNANNSGGATANVNLDADVKGDEVIVNANGGRINYVANGSTAGRNVLLEASLGIGTTAQPVVVDVTQNLAARLLDSGANGGIFVRESAAGGDLPIGALQGVNGLSTPNNQSIEAHTTNGSFIVNANVIATGSGNVTLIAESTGAVNAILAGGGGRVATTNGTIDLQGSGIGDGPANPLLLRVGAGTLRLVATGTGAGGDISVSNDTAGGLNTSQITALSTAAGSQRVTLIQTAGSLTVGADIGNSIDDFVLRSTTGSIDGSRLVTAHNLLLDANQGIGGGGGPLQTQVDGVLAALVNASGGGSGISILETAAGADLTVGTFAGLTGVTASNGQAVELRTDGGRLVINAAVSTVSAGAVLLKSAGTTSEVAINALVKTETGPNRVQSERDITFGAGGGVRSTSGDVELSADFDFNVTGAITMGDSHLVDAGSGHVLFQAAGNVTLGGLLTTNADCSTTSSAVRIESRAGEVVDGGDALIDVDSPNGQLQILAQTGIGSSGPFGALETRVACLDVETKISGNVAIIESDAALVFRANNDGNGEVLIQAGGTLTVDNSSGGALVSAVTATTGKVTLEARGPTSDLIVNNHGGSPSIVSGGGNILLAADRTVAIHESISTTGVGTIAVTGNAGVGAANIALDSGSDVTTSDGEITMRASQGIVIASAGSSIKTTGAGNITLASDSVDIAAGTGIDGGTNTVSIRQLTNSTGIDVGTATDAIGGPLGLSDAELDRVTAGTINIGDVNSGELSITAPITRTVATNLNVTTGGNNRITFSGGGALDAKGGNVTLITNIAGAGGIVSGTAANDVTANTLTIIAGSAGIGASGNPLATNVVSLVTNSDAATDGTQFLSEADSVTVGAADLAAGGQVISLNGGTFFVNAAGSILSNVVVNGGATLGGTGTVDGNVLVNSLGTLSPGNSPGCITTNDLTLTTNSTFTVEINGPIACTDHDQVIVRGNVVLGGATLNAIGTAAVAVGQNLTIIANNGTNAVGGTFAGLNEGALVTINSVVGPVVFAITYSGGDGNDVVLLPQHQVTVNAFPSTVLEDDVTGLVYVFSRTSGTTGAALTVSFNVGGSATFPADYTPGGATTFLATSGTVTFSAGSSNATITIVPIDDSTVEPPETVELTVTPGTGYIVGNPSVATNSITDNDSAVVSIARTTDGDETGPVDGVFTVTLSAPSSTDTVLTFGVGGVAQSGIDFTALSGTVTIPARGRSASIVVPVIDDPTPEGTESVTVTLTAITSGNTGIAIDPANATATLNIADNDGAPINDAPAGTDGSATINEDTSFKFAPGNFGFTDPNDTPANSFLAVVINTLPAGGTLELSGVPVNPAQVIPVGQIGNLIFTPAPQQNGTPFTSLTFSVRDDGGTAGGGQDTDPTPNTFTFNVTPVDDPPVNSVPGPQATDEDTSLVFSGSNGNRISIADLDAGTGIVAVTLTAGNGTANVVGNTSGLTSITGNGSGTVLLTGTVGAINNALSAVTYDPIANFTGAGSLQIVTNDQGNTGSGGPLTDSDAVAITVNPVNDPPAGTDGSATIDEDTSFTFALGAFGFSDPNDSPANAFLAVVVNTLPVGGSLELSGVPVTPGQVIPVGQIGNLIFTPLPNQNGAPFASVTFSVRDDGGTAIGGQDTDPSPNTFRFNVTPVNDAPVNSVPVSQLTDEDTPLVFSGANGNRISISDLDAGGNPVRVTLAATNGTITLNGIGGLTFSLGDGTANGTMTFSGTVTDINAALDGLSFTSPPNFSGGASLRITTIDLGNTGTGGPLIDTDVIPITINAINDPPVNSVPGQQTTSLDTPLILTGTTRLSISDLDAAAGIVSVTLTAGSTATVEGDASGLTSLTGNGTPTVTLTGTVAAINSALSTVTYRPSSGFTGTSSLQIVTNDQGNTGGGQLVDTDTVPITVTPEGIIFFPPGPSGSAPPGGSLAPLGGPRAAPSGGGPTQPGGPPPLNNPLGNNPPGNNPAGRPPLGSPPPTSEQSGFGGRREPQLPTDFLVTLSRLFAPDENDGDVPVPVRIDGVPITEAEVVLRPIDAAGRELRSLRLPEDTLDNLPALFKKLERGRFRVYFRDAGEERLLLIREVKLLDGRAVDDTDAGLDKPPTPAAAKPGGK